MSNDQAQTPTEGLDKMSKRRAKQKKENKSNDKGYNKSKNMYAGNSRTASSYNTSSRNFERQDPSIRVFLVLRFKNIYKKSSFDIFREKMGNYISRTMKYG